jgi:hypothetical protein
MRKMPCGFIERREELFRKRKDAEEERGVEGVAG